MERIARRPLPHENLPDATVASSLYWAKFSDVGYEDVNAVLGIVQQVTGKDAVQIGEERFEELKKIFLSLRGLVEIEAGTGIIIEHDRTNGAVLELRRLPSLEGYYARFTLRGIGANNVRRAQAQIDGYFMARGAQPLSDIPQLPPSFG